MDINEILEEVQAEFEVEVDETEVDEVEETDLPEEDTEPEQETEVEEEEETEEEPTKEENAFKRMRQENDNLFKRTQELSRYEQLIEKIAETSGKSTEEVVEFYENKLLEEQAEAQGTTPEFLQLQSRLEQLETQREKESFNTRMGTAVENLGLGAYEVQDFFKQCNEANIDLMQVADIQAVYKGFNFDKVLESELQKRLDTKKKRMETTGIPHGGIETDTSYNVDADVEDALKRFNVL
jgi:hypothetical protein